MFGFMKRIFVSAMMFFVCNLSSVNPLECVLMNNRECKVRPEVVNVNSKEPESFPLSNRTVVIMVVVIISMTRMKNFVFLMLLKI